MLVTLGSDWMSVLASLTVAVALLVIGGRYPRPALMACASAFVLTFIGHVLTAKDAGAVSFFIFRVSEASVAEGLRLGLRIALP